MSKVTTADCKKFLADFFTTNPEYLPQVWDEDDPDTSEKDAAFKCSANPKNWVREYKVKPSKDHWNSSNGGYDIATGGSMLYKDINYVRSFVLSPTDYDSMIRFMIVEGKDGELYLGPADGD